MFGCSPRKVWEKTPKPLHLVHSLFLSNLTQEVRLLAVVQQTALLRNTALFSAVFCDLYLRILQQRVRFALIRRERCPHQVPPKSWDFSGTMEKPINPGRKYIRPPPPLSPFLAKRHFSGEGVGVYILRPHAAGILYAPPPPFYTPPTPRRVFSGVGGWGCIKFGPVINFRQAQSTRTAKFDPTSGPTKAPTRAPTRVPTRDHERSLPCF